MTGGVLGSAVVTCPACGESVVAPVALTEVKLFNSGGESGGELWAQFAMARVKHACRGRDGG